jgi:hypothetical protein
MWDDSASSVAMFILLISSSMTLLPKIGHNHPVCEESLMKELWTEHCTFAWQ